MDYYEDKYGNAFLNYYLPRAVIFFKQAVGRLIRNETDSGYWIILDGRVKTKNYGRFFLEVLKEAEKVERFW
jgi:ATP-dependent DNA helicase DinG